MDLSRKSKRLKTIPKEKVKHIEREKIPKINIIHPYPKDIPKE